MKTALDPRQLKLMSGKLVVEISNKARVGNILTPDNLPQANNTGRILHWAYKQEKGKMVPDVNLPPGTRVGDIILFQSRPIQHRTVPFQAPFDYCDVIEDSDVIGVVQNGIPFPVGTKLLVTRYNDERTSVGGIIVPGAQPTTDQSHWVKFFRRGLPKYHWKTLPPDLRKQFGKKRVWQLEQFKLLAPSFQPGVVAKLKGWNENMREVGLPGGRYGLIIDEEDIAAYYPIDTDPGDMELD